ncbi:MAG: SMC-Scp complex subunit ScpB [Chloroflexota bacterium]|nr:MAG: SMC-Scp complex subunit ScpB [Chloroflexota bacterium]
MDQPPLLDIPPVPTPTTVQLVESLLFIAGEPVAIADLARALEIPADAVEAALEDLARACEGRGVRVQRHGGRAQLVSAPEAAAAVERFLGVQGQPRISAAALEVLAIIAYRQPVTRAQVEAIRGVDSGGVIRALLARELIAEVGRLETVGRPILYGTTPEFLRQFGLSSLAELPPLELFGPQGGEAANDRESSGEAA